MMQFIPIIITPQVFFCGLFELSPLWAAVGKLMPLYYTTDALKGVMIRGEGLLDIWLDLLILLLFTVVFLIANTQLLRKHRKI